MVVHRDDVHEFGVVVGGHERSVIVDVRALNGGIDVFVVTTDDHVDLGGWRVFLAGHLGEGSGDWE